MTAIKIPFEGKDIDIELPESWQLTARLTPALIPEPEDLSAALTHALENPMGCDPLDTEILTGKILIVVDDISRPTPTHLFFNDLLEYLFSKGAKKENLSIITALGVHRSMTRKELEDKLGADNISGIEWTNHDCKDKANHVSLGKTRRGTPVFLNKRLAEADLILCLGLIEPHALLGFGGGLKIILPGLAHEETIAANHMQGVTSERFNYVGMEESPMRYDLEEAVSMLNKRIFLVNVILSRKLKIARFICGDHIVAHREGSRISKEMNAQTIDEPVDVAIVTSSPMNSDLRQGLKCIANVEKSVKKSGLILAFLECKHGVGDISIPERPLPINQELLHRILNLLSGRIILWLAGKARRNSAVEEKFLSNFSLQVARKNRIYVYSRNLPSGIGRRAGLFRQFSSVEEMFREAARHAPRKAKVSTSPYGGATYSALNIKY